MPRFNLLSFVLAFAICVSAAFAGDTNTESAKAEFFEAKIRPVLVEHCFECHSAAAKKIGGEFVLDSSAGLRRGGESGDAIDIDDPDSSLLLHALRYDGIEMPPKGQLPKRVIADFETWIRTGALDPRESKGDAETLQPQNEIDIDAGREFWSFQRPRQYDRPEITNADWPQRKADWFVLARLEQEEMQPAETAPRNELLRRVTFDLTGLPPRRDELQAFLNDHEAGAYERAVDRLLASPQFGARWARLWLDVARYAEDQAHIVGNNQALFYPNAWRYRDWLIDALNDDMPYDRFVRLQLAADILDEDDHLVALGFLGLGPKYYRRNAPEVMADEWEDRVDTVSRGLLGLTVACARCHDHKYDPIPTEDYYALAGVFASTEMYNRPFDDWKPKKKNEKAGSVNSTHILRDKNPRDINVHIRGDAFNKGEVVRRRFLQVTQQEEISLEQGSGRLPLAEAITSPDNPLSARVFVNRVWAQYFGRGLVATESNFGQLGGRPTHPKLLDDLAVRFMQSGWSMKWLHREIVMSSTYRQSSLANDAKLAADPANELLGRMSRRRLSIEMWRDSMLSVANKLNLQVGGKSLDVQKPDALRRSVYAKVSRLELDSMLQMFDFPDPNVHAANRVETTTPLQKLFAMNNPFVVRRAADLAERLQGESSDAQESIRSAYLILYARQPTEQELQLGSEFVQSESGAWQQYAQILLASNEMLFLD